MIIPYTIVLYPQVLLLFNPVQNQLPQCQQRPPCSLHVFIAGGLPEEGIWRVWQGRRNHQPDLHGDDPEEHGGGRNQGAVMVEIEIIFFLHVLVLYL